jgi:hypothetical protein
LDAAGIEGDAIKHPVTVSTLPPCHPATPPPATAQGQPPASLATASKSPKKPRISTNWPFTCFLLHFHCNSRYQSSK